MRTLLAASIASLLATGALGSGATNVNMAAAPNPFNLLVVRSAGAGINIDEYASTSNQGTSYVATTSVAACTLPLGAQQSYGTNSVNGQYAFFVCGTSANTNRIVARVSAAGVIDMSTYYTTTSSGYLPRGVASTDGSAIWIGDGSKYWYGAFGTSISLQLTNTNYYYGVSVAPINGANFGLYIGCGSSVPCTATMYKSSVALPTTTSATFDQAVTGLTSLVDPGMFIVSPVPATTTTIYFGSDITSGGLQRLTSASGTGALGSWAIASWATGGTLKNPTATAAGVHGMASRFEMGAFVLYLTTSATSATQLWRYDTTYDTSSVVGLGYTQIATAPASQQFTSVFVVPTVTATPTQTPTSSVTASQTGTQTSSRTASNTGTPTQTATASLTATQTATNTASASLSAGASPSNTASSSTTGTPSSSNTGSGSSSHTGTPSSSQTQTSTQTSTPTPSNTASETSTASQTASSSDTSTQTSSSSATHTQTSTQTASPSQTASQTATRTNSPTQTASPSQTASQTATRSRTASITASTTSTPSNTATVSPFHDRWGLTNVLLLRVNAQGAVVTSGPGYAATCTTTATYCSLKVIVCITHSSCCGSCSSNGCPACTYTYTYGSSVFIDEVNPATGAIVSTFAMPSSCYLFWGSSTVPGGQPAARSQEGFPQLSADGRYFTVPCYAGPVAPGTNKALMRVYADGTVVATSFSGSYNGNSFSLNTAASSDGSGFWVGGTSNAACDATAGVRYIGLGGSAATLLTGSTSGTSLGCGTPGVGSTSLYGGQLYATFQDSGRAGLYSIGGGLQTTGTLAATQLPGIAGGTPWSFVFQSSTSLWLADSSNLAVAHIYNWAKSGASWSQASAVLFSTALPVYSITGRPELSGSTFVLYAVACSTTSDAYSVWKYDTVSTVQTQVLANAGGSLAPYRAVILPPFYPSSSASPTSTPSKTGTPSSSSSWTGTASISASASLTASNTPSSSQTPSNTATTSETSTDTSTSSESHTSSITASATQTSSITGSPSASLSFGATPTTTSSSSFTASYTGSSSGTGTPTSSTTPSTSGTPTSSPSQTATATPTPTQTASPSQTRTPSKTSSSTKTPSSTPSNTPSSTQTPSFTPTLTPLIDSWNPGNVLVVRIGTGTGSATTCPGYLNTCTTTQTYCSGSLLGVCYQYSSCCQSCSSNGCPACTYQVSNGCSVFLDEVSPSSGAVVSSFAVTSGSSACLMFWGAGYTQEGFAQLSSNGEYITVPCFGGPLNPQGIAPISNRVVMRVFADSSIVPTIVSDAYSGTAAWWRTAVTSDGRGFWVAGTSAAACDGTGGVRYIANLGAASSQLTGSGSTMGCGSPGAASLSVFNNQLYGSFQDAGKQGVYAVGTGLVTSGAQAATQLPGLSGGTPWSFVFQDVATMWLADSSTPATAHFYVWTAPAGTWSRGAGVQLSASDANPVYSLAGRSEGGVFTLYAVTSPDSDASGLYRFNTVSRAIVRLRGTTVGGNQVYRSVVFPPYFPSASSSPTPTSSITASNTATASQTPTQTPSPSQTASNTGSPTQTPSNTASSTGTPSITPSPSGTPTQTATQTSSPSSTTSSSASLSAGASPSTTQTGTPSASQTQTPSRTGTQSGTPSQTGTPTQTASHTATQSGTPSASLTSSPTPTSSASRTSSNTGSGSASASLTRSVGATNSGTPTSTVTSSSSQSSSITPSGTPSSSATTSTTSTMTASSTQSKTGTQTGTQSATVTRTASQTPSTSTLYQGVFQQSSVMVLRIGDTTLPATGTAGTAYHVYLDEYNTGYTLANTPVRTLSFPAGTCMLSYGGASGGSWFETEGLPALSGDGRFVSFPCYAQSSGNLNPVNSKTLVTVRADGIVSTATSIKEWTGGQAGTTLATRSAVTHDGSVLWASGSAFSQNGIYAATPGVAAQGGAELTGSTSGFPGYNDARALGAFNGQLYGTDSSADSGWAGVFTIGTGLPTSASATPAVLLPGFASVSLDPWTFVFESNVSLWVADTSLTSSRNVVHLSLSGGSWSAVGTASLAPGAAVYSIAGRAEAGVGWVLYGTTPTTLYRWAAGASAAIGTAATGTRFRGVTLAPFSPVYLAATPLPTYTPTQSITGSSTGTASLTSSRTATASASSTRSPTSSVSSTRTPTSSLTATRSPPATPSNTVTPTISSTSSLTASTSATSSVSSTSSPTASSSASSSASVTATRTSTRSPPVTHSETRTQTGTRTASVSGSSSPSSSASETVTPSRTPTKSGTATSSGSSSASASVSASGSVSGTPGSTSTSSRTQTRTASITRSRSPSTLPSHSSSLTGSPSASLSGTPTGSISVTASSSLPPSFSSAATLSGSGMRTPPASDSGTPTLSTSLSSTKSPIPLTATSSLSPSLPPTPPATASKTNTPTRSPTRTRTPTPSPTRTRSQTKSGSHTTSSTRTRTKSHSATKKK